MSDKPELFQIDYIIMEFLQKHMMLREARTMMSLTDDTNVSNDLYSFIEKLDAQCGALMERIKNA
jgi:hypothetical protein